MSSPSDHSPSYGVEKTLHRHESSPDAPSHKLGEIDEDERHEVFKKDGDVDFRNVGWIRCASIFLKIIFSTGVLSIPGAMASLGAVGGALSLLGWGALNTYTGIIQGNFRNRHRGCHSIADMAHEVGGVWLRELVGGLFIVAYVLCAGSSIVGVSVALNVFSNHGACTVWFAFVAAIMIAMAASVHTMHKLGWLTWVGFFSIFIALFIVVVAVTTHDRPAAAPQAGPFELGYYVIAYPTFYEGMAATCTIFISSAGTSAFLPVISEMRDPTEYRKALYSVMIFTTCCYLAFALVVYRWCGIWVASPALGSAGDTIKIAAYAIGFVGLVISGCVYLHVAAKYLFVRILRNSKHLQSNTLVHWSTWLSCTFGLCSISFIIAEAVPIFNYLIAITGSICFAPLALMLPAYLWMHDFASWRSGSIGKQIAYWLHGLMFLLGAFLCIGGTYGVVEVIIGAYASGEIGGVFSCADTSGH